MIPRLLLEGHPAEIERGVLTYRTSDVYGSPVWKAVLDSSAVAEEGLRYQCRKGSASVPDSVLFQQDN